MQTAYFPSLSNHAVRILQDGFTIGSGFLLVPEDGNHAFILTAAHVLTGLNGDISVQFLGIPDQALNTRSVSEDMIIIHERYDHALSTENFQHCDAGLIRIMKEDWMTSFQPVYWGIPEERMKIHAIAFSYEKHIPELPHAKTELLTTILAYTKKTHCISALYSGNFCPNYADLNGEIEGMSGSVYAAYGQEAIILVGMLCSTIGNNAVHGQLNITDMTAILELLALQGIQVKQRRIIPAVSNKETFFFDIYEKIIRYHAEMYTQVGNYHLGEIHTELFPTIQDADVGTLYRDPTNLEVSLNQYWEEHPMQHILLLGEGGMGKTVSMLKTTEYLLKKRVHAVYIPLHTIDFRRQSLKEYIISKVFDTREYWEDMEQYAKSPPTDKPNLVLLLDGINEVNPDYVEQLLRSQIRDELMRWSGTQLILSSRYDFRSSNNMESTLQLLTMQDLEQSQIEDYLTKMGLPHPNNDNILSLLRNPLRLTLYADAEVSRSVYSAVPGIELEYPPDSPGKIIGNYIKTQLFRAARDNQANIRAYQVLLEYALPEIAYNMVCNSTFILSQQEIIDILAADSGETYTFRWYEQDRMHQLDSTKSFHWNSVELFNISISGLHFLCKTGKNSYEYLHQSFRDYFSALHLANEMRWIHRIEDRFSLCDHLLEKRSYPNEILSYVADITSESKATPSIDETGIHFPGKCGPNTASEFSIAEQLLDNWRRQEGAAPQIAVSNLLTIMALGRSNNLAWCNFSELDLRGCQMNGCCFVDWYCDDVYPSSFDGAWIDRTFLLNDGHSHPISAICTDGEDLLFSADRNGIVKIWHIRDKRLLNQFQLQSDTVQDLVWNSRTQCLGIMYANVVFLHNPKTLTTTVAYTSPQYSQRFRYLRFAEDDSLQVAYSNAPLTWYNTNGVLQQGDLDYDVAAHCAKENPQKKQYVRSYLQQHLQLCEYEEATGTWKIPVDFQERIKRGQECNQSRNGESVSAPFFSLRSLGATKGSGISSLCYHPDGSRFLLTIQHILLEFSANTFLILRKKVLPEVVHCACYGKDDCICVGSGQSICVLSSDMTELAVFSSAKSSNIRTKQYAPDTDILYLLSTQNEIKQLDDHLRVKRIRRCSAASSLLWCRDRFTNDTQILFTNSAEYPYGARYDYNTGFLQHLGWRYEALSQHPFHSEDSKIHNLGIALISVNTVPPYNKIIFENYSGVWIFDCTFRNIKGDMASEKNKQFLYQNGGVIYE